MVKINWADKKLLHLNKLYISNILSLDDLKNALKPFLEEYSLWKPEFENSEWFDKVITLLRPRACTLLDIVENFRCFHDKEFDYSLSAEDINKSIFNAYPDFINLCFSLSQKLAAIECFTSGNIESLFRSVAEKENVKLGKVCNAARVVITGQAVGASLFEIIEVIGKEKTVFRLNKAAWDEGYLLWLAENSVQIV